MDFTRQALQTNGKLFFKFQIHFLNEPHFFKIILALGLASEVGEAFVVISMHCSLNFELLAENHKIINEQQGWVYASEVEEAFVLIISRQKKFLLLIFISLWPMNLLDEQT